MSNKYNCMHTLCNPTMYCALENIEKKEKAAKRTRRQQRQLDSQRKRKPKRQSSRSQSGKQMPQRRPRMRDLYHTPRKDYKRTGRIGG